MIKLLFKRVSTRHRTLTKSPIDKLPKYEELLKKASQWISFLDVSDGGDNDERVQTLQARVALARQTLDKAPLFDYPMPESKPKEIPGQLRRVVAFLEVFNQRPLEESDLLIVSQGFVDTRLDLASESGHHVNGKRAQRQEDLGPAVHSGEVLLMILESIVNTLFGEGEVDVIVNGCRAIAYCKKEGVVCFNDIYTVHV